MTSRPFPPRSLWWLIAGFCVWFNALVFLYALHAIGCAFAWSAGAMRLSLSLVLLAHVAVLGWLWHEYAATNPDHSSGSTGAFMRTVVIWSLIAALVASIANLGPPLMLSMCM